MAFTLYDADAENIEPANSQGSFHLRRVSHLKKTEGIQTLNHAFQNKCGFVYCRLKGVTFEVTSTDKVVSWTHFRGLSVNLSRWAWP